MSVKTKEQFENHVKEFMATGAYREPIAFGICRVDRGQSNPEKILQASYPLINWRENYKSAAVLLSALKGAGVDIRKSGSELIADVGLTFINEALNAFSPFIDEASGQQHQNVQVLLSLAAIAEENGLDAGEYRVVFLFEDAPPESVEAVYLKLYALSSGKAPLRSVNLTGAFGKLHNVAWMGTEPIELDWLRENEIELKLRGEYPMIDAVDKFPRYLQHVIPADNTRILDGSKVRMGAHLAAGTTVMPGASYINFNAGTTGPVMVEGRISSSAIVGSGSDVGGGASILGVLSGTNGNPVSIGQNTLLGANSVTGIPLGDGCIVDAGVAILEGTKVILSAKSAEAIAAANPGFERGGGAELVLKGVDFASLHGIHFRQDSTTGQIVATRSKREVKLNEELH
jgi:2,3,4,5-tetrahydropyridine-2-carboxylate N-succinyltransferase